MFVCRLTLKIDIPCSCSLKGRVAYFRVAIGLILTSKYVNLPLKNIFTKPLLSEKLNKHCILPEYASFFF